MHLRLRQESASHAQVARARVKTATKQGVKLFYYRQCHHTEAALESITIHSVRKIYCTSS